MSCIVNKVFVITLFLTILLGTAEGVGFGMKAGMNIANVYGDVRRVQPWIGFCGGGFADIGVGDIIAIQAEALYTQKGARWVGRMEPDETTLKLDYIEIPILCKFMLPVKGLVKPNLFVGPYVAINIDAKYKIEGHLTSVEWDYGEYVKDVDLGIVLGGGIDFSLTRGKIVFDCRYTLGWITTFEDGRDQKNKVVSFMLGYSF